METQEEQFIDWKPEDLLAQIHDAELKSMMAELCAGPTVHHPSRFWKEYVRLNIQQLQAAGLDNFKQTINQNYFNWTGGNLREQRKKLQAELGPVRSMWERGRAMATTLTLKRPDFLNAKDWRHYRYFLLLLWSYTSRKDRLGWLHSLDEPPAGNPLVLKRAGRRISQDICNSLLELNAAFGGRTTLDQPIRVAELGAGYGRVAYCVLQQCPPARYVIIDIPPALFVSQWYLSSTVPGRRVFRFRPFKDFATVREEFEAAEIAFLLPHQAELLPDNYFDLFLNISSLQEMTMEQVRFWFSQIDRLCRGQFYSKQWIHHENARDNLVIKRHDYPALPHWQTLYNRQCIVQPRFFEALYQL